MAKNTLTVLGLVGLILATVVGLSACFGHEFFSCLVGADNNGSVVSIRSGHAFGCRILVDPDGEIQMKEMIFAGNEGKCEARPTPEGAIEYEATRWGCVCDVQAGTCDQGAPGAQQVCMFVFYEEEQIFSVSLPYEINGCALERNPDNSVRFLPVDPDSKLTCDAVCSSSNKCQFFIREGGCDCDCPSGQSCDCQVE